MVIFVMVLAATLAVWLTDEKRKLRQANHSELRKKGAYVRVWIDELIRKGIVSTECN